MLFLVTKLLATSFSNYSFYPSTPSVTEFPAGIKKQVGTRNNRKNNRTKNAGIANIDVAAELAGVGCNNREKREQKIHPF